MTTKLAVLLAVIAAVAAPACAQSSKKAQVRRPAVVKARKAPSRPLGELRVRLSARMERAATPSIEPNWGLQPTDLVAKR